MSENVNHILIVDDNLKNLQLTGKLLKDEGYRISLAESGASALAMLETITPDLVLLDVMMPGMDGFEVCSRIKAKLKFKELPIIFLTAKNQTEDLIDGFSAGGVDYITKPFNREELLIRIKTHLELAESKRKILEMNQTRDKLYSIIAHDIRSPFATIVQIVHALQKQYLDPNTEDFREIITLLEQRTLETFSLLNNLLEWTKLHSERIKLSPKTGELGPLVSDCLQLLHGNIEQKQLTVITTIPKDCTAYFDEITMHTVFRNLISNSIKFSPEKGTISISASRSDEIVTIKVTDTGVGMSEEVMRKIFQQNEPHTTKGTHNESGSGLGLYLVKDFVLQNNGTLSVDSTLGKGSTFTIALPKGNS